MSRSSILPDNIKRVKNNQIIKILRAIASFLLLLVTISGISCNDPDQKTKIIFRFDDYRLIPDVISDSLINVFSKHKIPLCAGLIPYDDAGLLYNNLDPDQLNSLRERIRKKEISIALHGYNHVDNRLLKGSIIKKSGLSEYSRLPLADQFLKISKAKRALDSLLNTNIKVFIPPFNTYDASTLKVLDSLKFEVISANMDGYSGSGKISYIPYTTDDLSELPQIIRSNSYGNSTIIVVLHIYSFGSEYSGNMSNPVFISQLDTLLTWINCQPELLTTDFLTSARNENYDKKRFDLNSTNKNMLIKILNQFKIFRYGAFYTAEYLEKQKSIFMIFNILFHVIVFLLVYYTALFLGRMLRPVRMLRIFINTLFIAVIVLVLYKALNSHSLTGYLVLLTTASIAFFTGMKGRKHVISV